MLRRALILSALLMGLASSPAQALLCGVSMNGTCFAIAAGNWGTNGTWSNTSGGASSGTTPTTGDSIVFDGGSGTGTYTIDAAFSINTFDASAAGALTLVHNAFTLTVSGNTFKFSAAMTYTAAAASRIVTFTSTSGTTAITSAGKTFAQVITNGAGGAFQLQDDMSVGVGNAGGLTHTAGTLDANNHNLSTSAFASSNSNTRVITMGSGTWTISGFDNTLTTFDLTTTTGLTVNANTSTLAFTYTGNSGRTLQWGNKTFNNVTVAANANPPPIAFNGGGTFNSIGLTAPLNVTFAQVTTYTITAAFNWAGSSSNQLSIRSNVNTAQPTLSVASGTPTMSWAALMGIICSGGATFTATNSFNLQGNSGITITAPSGGGRIIGG